MLDFQNGDKYDCSSQFHLPISAFLKSQQSLSRCQPRSHQFSMIFELFVPKNSNRLATELARRALTRIFKGKEEKKKKKKKKRDLWRTEVKTLKKKRWQMEKNQTAPCESGKPFSDGAAWFVWIDWEEARDRKHPLTPRTAPETQTHYFIWATSSVLIDTSLYFVLIS